MGDSGFDLQQLSRETFRLNTYDANTLAEVKNQLAKAGFFYTRNGHTVKCFSCDYEFDASGIQPDDDVMKLHKEKQPDCVFAKKSEVGVKARSKKFLSYDSLRYEKERLETFIEWPIPWLSPEDLAADGFYYLRTADHCACVFCRGIVGAWEMGDTPRGEHKRHFPHCPFIRDHPVGNVPLLHSTILDKLPLEGEECPLPPPRCEYTHDDAGTSSATSSRTTVVPSPAAGSNNGGSTSGRHMPGSYAECNGGPTRNTNVNYDEIGLRQYSGPKRKDYITKESREKSFTRWPERVAQKKEAMAEAGFFYCGLSDHVRCFHCGSGLRNWEIDDDPWEEHARWYPNCNYVIIYKGQEFVDKVRREKPPYLRTAASKDGKPQKVSASSGTFKPISDEDLNCLMHGDIIQVIRGMGFPEHVVRKALRRKLEQTGIPFFSIEPCIETVVQVMEEETRQTIQAPSDEVEDEAMARQNDKMRALNIEPSTLTSSESIAGPSNAGASAVSTSESSNEASASGVISVSTADSRTPEPSVSNSTSQALSVPSVSTASSTPTTTAAAVPSQVSSTPQPPPQLESQAEAMDIDDEQSEIMETQPSEGTSEESAATQSMNVPRTVEAMQEADERISIADELLKPTRPVATEEGKDDEGKSTTASVEGQVCEGVNKSAASNEISSREDIAEELERIKESRTCKICMDAEMAVVFLPCAHMATCAACAVAMTVCPICRHDIKYTVKPIFS